MKTLLTTFIFFACAHVLLAEIEINDPFTSLDEAWVMHEGINKKGTATFELHNTDAFDTDKITAMVGGAIERRFSDTPMVLNEFEAFLNFKFPENPAQYSSIALSFYGKVRLYIMVIPKGDHTILRIEEADKVKNKKVAAIRLGSWYKLSVTQAAENLQVSLREVGAETPVGEITRVKTISAFTGVGIRTFAETLEVDDFLVQSSVKKPYILDLTIRNEKPKAALQMLRAGEIMPTGWLKEQVKRDIETGFFGNFDSFGTMVSGDLFGNGEKRYSVNGYRETVGKGTRGGKGWWSGEHEGYWKDGMVRMAFMAGDEGRIEDAHKWIESILDYASKNDGYIGVYGDQNQPGGRFNHPGHNGELWTQSRIFTTMLAYYGFTDNEAVLDAVIRAVDLTMSQNVNFFFMPTGGGGIPHGVGFFETLKELYDITGDRKYIHYTIKLFKQYNESVIRYGGDDLKTQNLVQADKKLDDHTPHLGEAAQLPYFISMITETDEQKIAAKNWLIKLDYHSNPSGSVLGDENIHGRPGGPDMLYEHCAQMEFLATFRHLMQLNGSAALGDRIEKMMFNAIQGAIMSNRKGVVYCSSDNKIEHHPTDHGGRLIYSACHGAACCALTVGRSTPHYVQSMWMKDAKGLRAMTYGPATVETDVMGTLVAIEQVTTYPFENQIVFSVKPESPTKFAITLRKPFGSKLRIEGVPSSQIKESADFVEIERTWTPGDAFKVTFGFDVKMVEVNPSKTVENGGYFLQYGPLLFAKAFPSKTELREDFGGGFGHFDSTPTSTDGWNYKIDPNAHFVPATNQTDSDNLWGSSPLVLKGALIDDKGKAVNETLVPMATATFRRVAFPRK